MPRSSASGHSPACTAALPIHRRRRRRTGREQILPAQTLPAHIDRGQGRPALPAHGWGEKSRQAPLDAAGAWAPRQAPRRRGRPGASRQTLAPQAAVWAPGGCMGARRLCGRRRSSEAPGGGCPLRRLRGAAGPGVLKLNYYVCIFIFASRLRLRGAPRAAREAERGAGGRGCGGA